MAPQAPHSQHAQGGVGEIWCRNIQGRRCIVFELLIPPKTTPSDELERRIVMALRNVL